jgi:hypothetical protein
MVRVVCSELSVHPSAVPAHSASCQLQVFRDVDVRQSVRKKVQNLKLSPTKSSSSRSVVV